jgi:hypothetical protein
VKLTLKTPWSPKMLLPAFREGILEGIEIHIPPVRQYRGAFLNDVPWVEITVAVTTVAANAVTIAAFIWKKFGEGKKPVEKVIINRREEIKWTQDALTRVIEEEFKKETSKEAE